MLQQASYLYLGGTLVAD